MVHAKTDHRVRLPTSLAAWISGVVVGMTDGMGATVELGDACVLVGSFGKETGSTIILTASQRSDETKS